MVITKLEPLTKYKFKVYIDYEFAFCLSNREIFMYQIKQDSSLLETTYQEIEQEVIKKAKIKAMDILKLMDRTENELRVKLRQAHFLEHHIEEAIAYVKSFHYIDDERYAMSYIKTRNTSKSQMQIKMALLKKGISSQVIQQVIDQMSELYDEDIEDAQMQAVRKLILKKCKNSQQLSKEEKDKVMASLYRKGFQVDLIKRAFFELELE